MEPQGSRPEVGNSPAAGPRAPVVGFVILVSLLFLAHDFLGILQDSAPGAA